MPFPASPSNNDVHKVGNRAFTYDSTLGTWDQVREVERTENKLLSGEIGGAVTGTLGSEVTFPAGHVLQVKHFPYHDRLTISATATSIPFVGSEGGNDYGCPITLSSSTNKVYVAVTVYSGNTNGTRNHQFRLMYNTSVGGSWTNSPVNGSANYWALVEHNTYAGVIHQNLCHSVNDIITPNSTTVWFKNHVWQNASAITTSYVGASGSGTNYSRATSMILMEIEA